MARFLVLAFYAYLPLIPGSGRIDESISVSNYAPPQYDQIFVRNVEKARV